jgi:hypothetical protein
VDVATLVLLHSPLTGAAAWGRLPQLLADEGLRVVVPEVTDDGEPPFAARYVAEVARQVGTAEPDDPLVLVAHSGAGPLLPQVGFARRAVHRPVSGYVFVDAGLPAAGAGRSTATRLDLMRAEDAPLAAELRQVLESGERFPRWSVDELAGEVADAGDRAVLAASLRPRGLAFFTEPLPFPGDWPDGRCGYLRTSAGYRVPARQAGARGWPVLERELGHFAALDDADATGTALLELLRLM